MTDIRCYFPHRQQKRTNPLIIARIFAIITARLRADPKGIKLSILIAKKIVKTNFPHDIFNF